MIPAVSGYQIDRRRLALAGGAAQRRQRAPEWTVAPLKQHLHRMQDCPRRTWASQFKPALEPVGQALVEVEGRRVQGALRAERVRVDLLGGRGKRWGDTLLRCCDPQRPFCRYPVLVKLHISDIYDRTQLTLGQICPMIWA